ncbi:hypothetical protein D3C72_2535350 [compost metagenome]
MQAAATRASQARSAARLTRALVLKRMDGSRGSFSRNNEALMLPSASSNKGTRRVERSRS